eukprot:gene27402-34111_t
MSSVNVAYFDPAEVEVFDRPKLLDVLSRIGSLISGNEWNALVGSKLEVDHDFVSAYCQALFARNRIPREHEDRVNALKTFFQDQHLALKKCPLKDITVERLFQESPKIVKYVAELWRLVPTDYSFPDEFESPITGDSLAEIPKRVRKEVLCEFTGWLRDFLDVDVNSLSFIWLEPQKFHLADWVGFAKKLGFPNVAGKAAEKVVVEKVKSVLDRPFLLSPRRLKEVDLEIFLPAISDLVCNDSHEYSDIDDAESLLLLKGLTVIQLQDMYVVAGKPTFTGPMPRNALELVKRIASTSYWKKHDRTTDLMDLLSDGAYSRDASGSAPLVCYLLLNDPRPVGYRDFWWYVNVLWFEDSPLNIANSTAEVEATPSQVEVEDELEDEMFDLKEIVVSPNCIQGSFWPKYSHGQILL